MTTTRALVTSGRANMLAVIDGLDLSPTYKHKLTTALGKYLATGASISDADALRDYAQTLSGSGKAFLKAAVGHIAERLGDEISSRLDPATVTPEEMARVQAAHLRLDVLQKAVKVQKPKGQKTHTWLSQKQVLALYQSCGNGSLEALRDRVALGLLVAGGLRRTEAVGLRWSDVKIQSKGERNRTVLAVKGKGAKNRTVPVSDRFAALLVEWRSKSAGKDDDFICRSLGMDKNMGEGLSAIGLFKIVRKRGSQIGKPHLAPHDLRRSFAMIGYDQGIPITQLSVLLGHENVNTTMRYLNVALDLTTTASDFVPWG